MESTAKQFRKRNAILECLRRTQTHPSADALYQRLREDYSDISLASVYRNLTWFKEQGLIISLGTVNGIERFDGRTDPHIHFACNRCCAVSDVDDLEIPAEIAGAASSRTGCRIDSIQLILTGICAECLGKKDD